MPRELPFVYFVDSSVTTAPIGVSPVRVPTLAAASSCAICAARAAASACSAASFSCSAVDGSVALPVAAVVAIALPEEAFATGAGLSADDAVPVVTVALSAAAAGVVILFPLRPLRAVTRTGLSAPSVVVVSCGFIVPV